MARKTMGSWKPHRSGLGGNAFRAQMGMNSGDTQMLGVAVLSALSIAGLHSAVCPSYFTMKTFASQPEARQRAMEGLYISLALSTLASGALYFIFKSWTPALVAEATALALFGISVAAVTSEPPKGIPPIEQQQLTTQAPVSQPATV